MTSPAFVSADQAQAMADTALACWGAAARPPLLIKIRENIVFRVWFADGRTAALRLHRPGYQSRASIEAELEWTAALAGKGLCVPAPLATRKGGLTATAGDRIASCVAWLDGSAIGSAEQPLNGSRADQVALFDRLGQLLGRLHAVTDTLDLPAAANRPVWDESGFFGETPLWGRFWENPAFGAAGRRTVLAARDKARAQLQAMRARGCDFGLIHADALRENVMETPGGLALIDFDDSGFGFRLYDLGTALLQNLDEPNLACIAAALASGYRRGRPVAALDADMLTLFVLLRCFASTGWIMTRAPQDDPRQGFYTKRALRLARHFMDGTAPWGRVVR